MKETKHTCRNCDLYGIILIVTVSLNKGKRCCTNTGKTLYEYEENIA